MEPEPRAATAGSRAAAPQGGYRPLPPLHADGEGGGGGLISLGIIGALTALVLQVGPELSLIVWLIACLSLVGGFWQMRHDRAAFHRAGAVTVSAGIMTLAIITSRTIDLQALPFPWAGDEAGVVQEPLETPDWAGATEEAIADATRGARGDVRMAFGGPAHTGEHPGPGPSGDPRLRWEISMAGEIFSAPIVADNVIYVGSKSGFLLALDAKNGREHWRFDLGNYIIRSSAAAVDGMVYVVGGYDIYALDATSGQPRWRLPIKLAGPSSPAVVDGVLYVASQEGELYAVEVETGALAWHYKADGLVFSSPAVAGGMVFIANDAGDLYALEVGTGRLRWRISGLGAVYGSPAVGGGTVFVSSLDGMLVAVDIATGEERWRFTAGGSPTPAVVDGMVYAAAGESGLVALDVETGKPRWTFATGAPITSSPTVADDVIYVGSGATLHAIDAEGESLWRYPTRDVISASPAVAGGLVLLASQDGHLYALGGTEDPAPVS
ncbi:MAG TPA: PQQ-binding-like beta-propeller repeat protein [Thermomicrobiales bacterium]|nr:PQQ-binding-like beta-propeller repeat protein [Thermomicrobiales bacterium]